MNIMKINTILVLFLSILSFTGFAQTTFTYTGAMQTYTVPSGVTTIWVDVQGAKGGNELTCTSDTGGAGGRTQATLAVVSGSVIYVYVGKAGDAGHAGDTTGIGIGGGGAAFGSGDGGGASDIRIGGTALTNRVIVAGGGGGACGAGTGGAGGGLTGGDGTDCNVVDSGCGRGGTQTAGGAGAFADSAGSLGFGGNTNNDSFGLISGGGGGGGYYGGGCGSVYDRGCGGGGNIGGGGGGSSYADPSVATGVIHTQGYNRSGNGIVKIYTHPVGVNVLINPSC